MPIEINTSNISTAAAILDSWFKQFEWESKKAFEKVMSDMINEMYQKTLNGIPFDEYCNEVNLRNSKHGNRSYATKRRNSRNNNSKCKTRIHKKDNMVNSR